MIALDGTVNGGVPPQLVCYLHHHEESPEVSQKLGREKLRIHFLSCYVARYLTSSYRYSEGDRKEISCHLAFI